jgi:hypothetical protein
VGCHGSIGTETGDLVCLGVDVGAGQHSADGGVVGGSQHVPGGGAAIAGSAQRLAVHRDRRPATLGGLRAVLTSQPAITMLSRRGQGL